MKILAITNLYPSAEFPSHGVFVQEQIKGLCAVGLEVRVLFVDRRRSGPLAYYRLQKKIRDAVAEFEPEVIHAMYGGVMADQIVRHHHVCPVVVTFRGSDLLGENLSGWTRKIISRYGVRCSRRAAKKADGVVVVARHLIGALNGAATMDKVRVIPSGIDLTRFTPLDSQLCKQKLGWNPQSFHVVFASSSGDPVKRPWLAQAAVDQVRRLGCPAEFHFITGIPTTEMPLWLNAGDAVLLTSLHEGSPNIVKEALACGLPVVSVDVGDVAEQLEGVDGCHLAQPEPAALAAKLRQVWQRGQRLDCRNRCENFSVLNVAQKLKKFYEETVLANKTSRLFATRKRFSIPAVVPAAVKN
jgi:teichuronic acid biosynthesis glycosyltransferase TuaC